MSLRLAWMRGRGLALALAAAVGVAALLLAPTDRARAACDPAAASNITATCTGNTVNQEGGAPGTSAGTIGYGTGAETNLNVTVVSGASVAGALRGIAISSGTIINFGTVGTIGGGGNAGITLNTGSNVINFGTITGGSQGISAGALNVSNSGTITGSIDTGISAPTGSVTNSGTISGPTAISFSGGGADTLTLLPGSKIIGAIRLFGGGDTVNVLAGNQNLTFDTLVGATVTSNVPFVVSGNRVVTIDPTSFVVAGTALGDFSRSVSAVVPVFNDQAAAAGGMPMGYAAPAPGTPASVVSAAFDHMPGLSAYAADTVAFKAPTVTHADGTTFWARGFGGQRVQQADGVVLRNVSNFFGGAMGLDKALSPNLRVGAFIGAGSTKTSIELNSGDSESNLGFGGLYARYLFGASFLHAAVQGGGSRNDTTRNNINNNLVAGGLESAKASFNGWYVSPELTLGHRIALGHVLGAQHVLTPSIQVRYLYASFGSYTETGSTANLTVNRQTAQSFEERAEFKLTRVTLLNPTSALLIHLTGGALGTQRVGSNTVDAVLLGQELPFATPGRTTCGAAMAGSAWNSAITTWRCSAQPSISRSTTTATWSAAGPACGSCSEGRLTLWRSCHGDRRRAAGLDPGDAIGRALRIADCIAGMTDRYAIGEHARRFGWTPELK